MPGRPNKSICIQKIQSNGHELPYMPQPVIDPTRMQLLDAVSSARALHYALALNIKYTKHVRGSRRAILSRTTE